MLAIGSTVHVYHVVADTFVVNIVDEADCSCRWVRQSTDEDGAAWMQGGYWPI